MKDTTSAGFFENKYQECSDPWDFATSRYERERYRLILEALSVTRYDRAFEPGCSVGILTERLAAICGEVEAMDIAQTAVEQARARCEGLGNVRISCGSVADAMPTGSFDLVVLSEIGYYFDEKRLQKMGVDLVERLMPGGTLLAAHWLGHSEDHVLSGDQVHDVLGALGGLKHRRAERREGFRLDVWSRQ